MAHVEITEGVEVKENLASGIPGKHDRTLTGYLPEIAGDKKITVDSDHAMAALVSSELPEDWQKRQEAYRAPKARDARRRENEKRGRIPTDPEAAIKHQSK